MPRGDEHEPKRPDDYTFPRRAWDQSREPSRLEPWMRAMLGVPLAAFPPPEIPDGPQFTRDDEEFLRFFRILPPAASR